MSLIPVFEIGLWNVWIFMLPYLLIFYGLAFFIVNKKSGQPIKLQLNKKEKKLLNILMVTYFALCIISIFLPLKLGTAWFYAGFLICLLGMIFITTATLNLATTPKDKPVTKGLFRISRNPIYFGMFSICIGIGIACISWIFLLLVTVFIILNIFVIYEEGICLLKYGNAYKRVKMVKKRFKMATSQNCPAYRELLLHKEALMWKKLTKYSVLFFLPLLVTTWIVANLF